MNLAPHAHRLYEQRFGHLVAKEPMRRCKRGIWWRCLCDCGNSQYEATSGDLRSGRVNSCGCYLRSEAISRALTTHGHCAHANRSRTYSAWAEMKKRCKDIKNEYYGGRGIVYDPLWEQFENFLADMGEVSPGLELDRRDNSLGYTKDNCRWATHTTQARNRRSTKLTEELVRSIRAMYGSGQHSMQQVATMFGVAKHAVFDVVSGRTWRRSE